MIIDVLKGFYPYFSLIALVVILIRIKQRKWQKAETILLSIILLHGILTIFQVGVFGDEWNFSRRYLLPVAPLAFGWTAIAVVKFYRKKFKIIFVFLALFLIYDAVRPALKTYYSGSKQTEFLVVNDFSEIIANDYRDEEFYTPVLWWDEYRSPKRPVVYSEFPALGYYAGGRTWTPEHTEQLSADYILTQDDLAIPHYKEIARRQYADELYILFKKY